MRNYHRCLDALLELFKRFQDPKMSRVLFVRLGDKVAKRRVFMPLAFGIGDAKSGDALCGRYGAHREGIQRMSRQCNVDFDSANDPKHQCQWYQAEPLHKLCSLAMKLSGMLPIEVNDPLNKLSRKESRAVSRALEDILKGNSTHIHHNSFHDVWFGANDRGILGATPTDPMHAFLSGVLQYVIKTYLEPFSAGELAAIDDLVDQVLRPIRSSLRAEYPRWNFSRGITNLTFLTADEWGGVAFSLMLVMLTEAGMGIMMTSFKRRNPELSTRGPPRSLKHKQSDYEDNLDSLYVRAAVPEVFPLEDFILDHVPAESRATGSQDTERMADDLANNSDSDNSSLDEEDNVNSDNVHDHQCHPHTFFKLLQWQLCFHAWYKRGHPFTNWFSTEGVGQLCMFTEAMASTRRMLTEITAQLPRSEGDGWQLQKLHELLHIPHDMSWFGSPQNFDAGPGERSLKTFAKKPAKTAQKSRQQFLEQVGQRVHTAQVLAKAQAFMPGFESMHKGLLSDDDNGHYIDTNKNEQVATTAWGERKAAYRIYPKPPAGRTNWEWLSKKDTQGNRDIHPAVLQWFVNNRSEDGKLSYDCYTSLHRNEDTYRAHPNFRSAGPWYDWAMVDFGGDCVDGDSNEMNVSLDESDGMEDGAAVHVSDGKKDMHWFDRHYGLTSMYPCKILCFFEDEVRDSDGNVSVVDKALVHSADFTPATKAKFRPRCALTESFTLEFVKAKNSLYQVPLLSCVDIDSVGHPVFVVEELPGVKETVLTKDVCRYRVNLVSDRTRDWTSEYLRFKLSANG